MKLRKTVAEIAEEEFQDQKIVVRKSLMFYFIQNMFFFIFYRICDKFFQFSNSSYFQFLNAWQAQLIVRYSTMMP